MEYCLVYYDNKKIRELISWGLLLVVILVLAWMLWDFPQSGDEVVLDDSGVFSECVDVENVEGVGYQACYDVSSELVFLKMDRRDANYDINKITVSFMDITSISYDFWNIPLAGKSSTYKFSAKENPGNLNVKLDVVRNSSRELCVDGGVFVDYCPVGIGSNGVGSGDVSGFPYIDSSIDVLGLADKEKIWESVCKSDWECEEWGMCEDGKIQRRDCRDMNDCIVPINSPPRVQGCDGFCIENWECEWSDCSNGTSTPQCNDLSECGTFYKIPKKLSCHEDGECVPNVVCGDWTNCSIDYIFSDLTQFSNISELMGSKNRLCVDRAGCAPTLKEEQNCSLSTDVRTEKFEKCGEEYVAIYNIFDDSTLAVLKDGAKRDSSLNIYFNDKESIYCDYCFDGIMNGDESDIDCGGSCKDCTAVFYYEKDSRWWDFLF